MENQRAVDLWHHGLLVCVQLQIEHADQRIHQYRAHDSTNHRDFFYFFFFFLVLVPVLVFVFFFVFFVPGGSFSETRCCRR